ncbi:hypothetical protein [Nonomuraea maritima]
MRDEVFEVLERYRSLSDGRADPSPDEGTGRVVVHFDVLPLGALPEEPGD